MGNVDDPDPGPRSGSGSNSDTDPAVDDFLGTAMGREDLLTAAADAAVTKAELSDRLDVSRSTVQRAVTDLTACGLLNEDRGVQTTLSGRRCLDLLWAARAGLGDLAPARGALADVDPDAPVEWPLLRGATVHTPTPANPGRPFEAAATFIREATGIRGLAHALGQPRLGELFQTRVIHDRAPLEVVFADRVIDGVLSRRLNDVGEMARRGFRAYAVPEVPFSMMFGPTPDGPRVVLTPYDDDSPTGTLVNDRPAAVGFAARLFERYRTRAADVTPAILAATTTGDGR